MPVAPSVWEDVVDSFVWVGGEGEVVVVDNASDRAGNEPVAARRVEARVESDRI